MADESLDGGGFEEVGVVFEDADQPVRGFVHVEAEVEAGGGGGGFQGGDVQIGQGEGLSGGVVQDEHHLEQRIVAEVAVHLKGIDDGFKGYVLVGVSIEGGFAHLLEELLEGQLSGHLGAEHQVVDEEADQVLGFAAIAIGHRGANPDVGLLAVAVEQPLKGGQQQHE